MVYDKMLSKYTIQEGTGTFGESGIEMPSEVLRFRNYYLNAFDKCMKNGVLAYLLTNKCYISTTNRIL